MEQSKGVEEEGCPEEGGEKMEVGTRVQIALFSRNLHKPLWREAGNRAIHPSEIPGLVGKVGAQEPDLPL